jgi:hypothetical protein
MDNITKRVLARSYLITGSPLRSGENQEFETDAPPGHCSTAALGKKREEQNNK